MVKTINQNRTMLLKFEKFNNSHEIEAIEIYDFGISYDFIIHFKNRQQMEEILREFDEVKDEPFGTISRESATICGKIYVYHTHGNKGKIHINTLRG